MKKLSIMIALVMLSGCSRGIITGRQYHAAPAVNLQNGVPVYGAGQCIGAVVNGVCNGTIQQNGAMPLTCHGQMVGGICTGPMF